MTLMESAQLLGNFGEFFGAIAVVITLVYLAVQIRGNARATEAQVHASLSAEMEHLATTISQDDALAEAMTKATHNEELTDNQQTRLTWWFGGFLRVCESHILQCKLGSTRIDLERPIAAILRPYYRSEFFRELIDGSVRTGTATDEFNAWLEAEILSSNKAGGQGDHLRPNR